MERSVRLVGRACASVALGLFSSFSFAQQCYPTHCVGTVEEIYSHVEAGGLTYVKIAGDVSKLNCTPVSGSHLTLPGDKPGSKGLMAMLLAAQASGRTIGLRIADGSVGCIVVYATLGK
ncbi:hypothetical protein [Ideonella paludis]|uniref:Uncharacterized protein n=1 Tax=Ideonella paludis TaxID=1233411 RepID=A0ABS5DVH2_9BURK|nr:hypothetical protein [Ideonella paludis]MBQ0935115.1 hypothetical protein [Ideonella paludis]